MKKQIIEINVYEKGDRVLTPNGIATVLEDEILSASDRMGLAYSKVAVQLDEAISSQPSGRYKAEVATFILEEEIING